MGSAAEDLGKRLLGEIEECGLDEVSIRSHLIHYLMLID